ncbi:uncharacterized protein LOC135234821 isoform X1 [Anguilla rostrata]|uniref:uncharacterized protein LOC135234821 isoform X1 n=1 Tax=Anguilla rostrata TaxID=7938 RepID=UPI0030D19F69
MEVACGAAEEQTPPEGGVAKLTETVPSPPQNVAPGLTLEGLKVETKVAAVRNVKKDIPAKKDRLEPLKIDMTKHFLLPPTSAQLSLQCLECHIIFSDHKSKERHLKQSHPAEYEQCMLGDALFACYVCDRHFTCSTELMAHQRAHTEKQPFKCPICGEAFRRSSELTIHKKVHFGLHGYTCADCGKPCKTLTLLKYHQRTHTGERPYVCKDCGKRFSMSKALQKHLLTHTAEEADGDGGGAVLLTPTGEATHIKRLGASSQGKPAITFSCSLCDGIFKTAKTRLQHMKLKHSHNRETLQNSIAAKRDHQNEGQPVETHTEICLPAQALQHIQTFAQGQPLQQIETLGQEQMQELISTLGQEQVKDKMEIMGPEHMQVQRETMGQEEGEKQTKELEWAQRLTEALCLEQRAPETLVLEQTQGQTETLCLEQMAPETLVLEQTLEQTETLCLEQRPPETLADVQTEQRAPETLVLEQTQEEIETLGEQQTQRQIEVLEPEQTQGQRKVIGVEQMQLQAETLELDLTQAQMETVVLEQTQEHVELMQLEHLGQLKTVELGEAHLQVDALEVQQTQLEMETVELELTQVQVETVELELTEVQVDTAELDLTQVHMESAELDLAQARMETDELTLAQVQVETSDLELEQVKTVELEQTEKQTKTLEQVETHPRNKNKGASLQQIAAEKDRETGQKLEHSQQLSGNNPGEKEKTSKQTQQLAPTLCQSLLPPGGPKQDTSQHQEIQLHTLKVQSLSKRSENKTIEPVQESPTSPPILAKKLVKGGQRTQSKKTTPEGKSAKRSQPLKSEWEFPGHAQQGKDLVQHCETQSKAKRTKSPRSKKERLVVRFIAPEKVKQSRKQKPVQTHHICLTVDRGHEQQKMQATPQLVQKVQLQQKTVEGKNVKTQVLPQDKMAHQQIQQIVSVKEKVQQVPLTKKKVQKCVVGQNRLEQNEEKAPMRIEKKKKLVPKRGQRSEKEGTPPEKKRRKKQEKVQDQNKKQKNQVAENRDKEKIKQHSLLLLKGHKQPQLKVHKLDPSKTQQQPQRLLSCPSHALKPPQDPQTPAMKKQQKLKKAQQHQKKQSQKQPKPQTKRKQKQAVSLLPHLLPSPSSPPIQVKPKTNRKRKASLAGAAETALGSPHARRALACADCGERFSEVLPLEEHKAAVHALGNGPGKCNSGGSVCGGISRTERETALGLGAESLTQETSGQGRDLTSLGDNRADKTPILPVPGEGALRSREGDARLAGLGGEMGLPVDLVQTPKLSESVLGNTIHPDNFGIQVATDWDMEAEMGEIGLGDKVERVSFPALNPSPSLSLATACVEVEGKDEGGTVNGESIKESVPSITSDLCASANEHSEDLKTQQKEEFNGSMNFSKDCAEDNSHNRMQSGVKITEDAPPVAVPTSPCSVCVFSPSLEKSFQATPTGGHNCEQSLHPSSRAQLQNFQQLETAKEEGQNEGREFEEKNKAEEDTSGSLQLTTSVHKPQSVTGEDIKEELLLEVDIVTVGDQSMEGSTLSQDGTRSLDGIPEVSHTASCYLSTETTQLSLLKSADTHTLQTKNQDLNANVSVAATQVSSCSADCIEIKQEEEEVEVERREGVRRRLERESTGRSGRRRGRGGDQRGGRRRIGLEITRETESEAGTEGCPVIFQLQSLSSDSPIKEEEGAELFHHSRPPPFKVHLQPQNIGPRCQQGELLLGTGISESCLPASLEESSDEQIVFELESVTTSVEVLKTEEGMEVEGTEDQVRVPGDCQSPSILFERFFAGRQRDEGDMEQCQNELRNDSRLQVNRASLGFGLETGPQNRASGMALMGAVTGQVIKVEDFSSNLVPCQNGPSPAPARKRGAAVGQVQPYEQRGGVRVFLVKEENPLVLDEPQEFPGCGHAELPDEEMRVEGNICADSEAMLLDDREGGGDGEREGAVSASPLALDIGVPGGEQCIVFRVKEEEREVALDPPQREHGLSVLLVSRSAALNQQVDQGHTSADGPLVSDLHPGSFTDSDGIWVSVPPGCGAEQGAAENEECEQSRERLIQTGSQPDVFVCTGEGELNTGQQNTQELLEFLVQTSDVEYSDSSDSEPEEEAFAMACYHEGSSSGTGKLTSKNLERSRFSIPVVERPGGSVTEGNGGGGRKELTPVEYFSQYLDWETWEEIAHCTPTFSETPHSVTSKEVAQFVGIHIAMGTLKFPDKRLYWQDFTRVPLIADAMPASRFFLLAKKLRLARRAEDLETPGDVGGGGHSPHAHGEVPSAEEPGTQPSGGGPDPEGTAAAARGGASDAPRGSRKTNPVGHRGVPSDELGGGASEQRSDPQSREPAGLTETRADPQTSTARIEHTHNTRSRAHYTHRRAQETGEVSTLEDKTHNAANARGNAQRPVELSNSTNSSSGDTDPLWQVRGLLDRVRAGCLALSHEGNYGVDQHPLHLGQCRRKKSLKNPRPVLQCTVLVGAGGLVLDLNVSTDDSGREDTLQRIIPKNKESGEAIVFLCKEELCTPAVLERLLVGGVRSAGRVGGVRGGVGDEFVSSDGKLTLLRCQQGFILSTLTERQAHQFSLIKDFEGVQKDAQLHRDLLNLYRTPLTASSPARWPQSVLWHLADLALVNSWLQYRRDRGDSHESLSLMAFRLEVAKGLIHANGRSAPQSAPPHPPAPKLPSRGEAVSPAPRPALPLPDAAARYDGLGHWPEQVAEGEGARCRFGGCERTSRVRCLKCCVFLCISRNHNCFLKFHIQGSL